MIMLLVGGFSAGLMAQDGPPKFLYLREGKVKVSKVFRPRSLAAADTFYLYLRKFQEVSLKIVSTSVFIGKDNECGVYFRLFDDKGLETKMGDSPAGIDDWIGYVDNAGRYKVKIDMGCLEAVTSKQIAARRPSFKYTLKIFQPIAPGR
jgi:hypothetical protein